MTAPRCELSVVIPYFQRERGVLARALQSIDTQRDVPATVSVIVVDDESPVPAQDEIEAADLKAVRVAVMRQANAGPAAARNAGLNAISSSCRYVAFLDSDDSWHEDHLARAVRCLEQGFDFYFANFLHLDQSVGAFERGGRLDLSQHPSVEGLPDMHAFARSLYEQVIVGNVIGTSTVVIRWDLIRDLRFQEEFVYAGEDYLFWMDCTLRSARAAFSSRIECTYGRGVNLYSGSGWGTPRSLDRIVHETRFRKRVLSAYPLNPQQRQSVREALARLRRAFAADVLHRLRTGSQVRLGLLARQARTDPLSYIELPRHVLSALMRRTA